MNTDIVEVNSNAAAYLKEKLIPVSITKLLPVLFLFIITILFAQKLPKYDYGQFQTIYFFSFVLCVVLNFGISSLILSSNLYSVVFFIRKNKFKIVAFYSLLSLTIFFVVYNIQNLNKVTALLLFLYILLQVVNNIIDAFLIKTNKTKVFVWLNFIYAILFLAIHLYFYFFAFSLNKLLVCLIILAALKVISACFIKLKFENTTIEIEENLFLKDWVFIGTTITIGIVAMWLDKIYMQYLMTPEEFAVFFNGAIELPFLGIIIGAMETILLKNISSNVSNKLEAASLFKESIKILSNIAIPLFFCFLIMHQEAFSIILKDKYNESIPIFFIYIFLIPLRVTHFGVILQCYGKANIVTLGAVLDLILSFTLMVILYPKFSSKGVAIALVVSTYLQVVFYLWKSADVLKMKIRNLIPVNYFLKLLISNALIFGILFLLKKNINSLSFLITTLIITGAIIVFLISNYWKNSNTAATKLL